MNKRDSSEGIHTVIIGHGTFPEGLLSAAEKIVGTQNGVSCISNEDLGTRKLAEKIEGVLTDANKEVYFFIDIVGGSCFNAARELTPQHPNWIVLAGVNLSMLVTYFSYRTRLSDKDLIQKTLQAGQRSIKMF